ncbi:MAG: OmpH family outer membrane protein [Opitutales bacterium]|nr:OmpH family outer membrane protein [Opitutales bacterium]MCH8539306.1 OmpH family outer membrane protein [Opitutales bacterium]
MKYTKTISLVFLLSLFAWASSASANDVPLRIATVNMNYLYENYEVTKNAMRSFQSTEERSRERMQEIMDNLRQLEGRAQELSERMENVALSESAREQAREELTQVMQEGQQKQQDMQAVQRDLQGLQMRVREHRQLMMEDIKDVVMEIVEEREITLVFDLSGPTALGIPPVIHSDPSFDITEDVEAILNEMP